MVGPDSSWRPRSSGIVLLLVLGARSIPGLVSGTGFAIRPLEQGEDGHCMAVAQLKIRLQPLDDGSRFHAWGEFAVLRKPLFLRKRAKVGGTLARLRLNVGKISLE